MHTEKQLNHQELVSLVIICSLTSSLALHSADKGNNHILAPRSEEIHNVEEQPTAQHKSVNDLMLHVNQALIIPNKA